MCMIMAVCVCLTADIECGRCGADGLGSKCPFPHLPRHAIRLQLCHEIFQRRRTRTAWWCGVVGLNTYP